MYSFFRKLIDQSVAIVYTDDILLLANTKNHVLDFIQHLHQICSSNNLKIAPDKSFYIILSVKFLGHESGNNSIKSLSSEVDGIHKLNTPTSKIELMPFIGSMRSTVNL